MIAAADLLADDFDVVADVWSVTSFTELRRDGIEVERWNLLHPLETPRRAYVSECLEQRGAGRRRDRLPPRIRRPDPPVGSRPLSHLGTDGFGRSDYRRALRRFFEVDRHYVIVAALKQLADDGAIDARRVQEAIDRYAIDPETPIPTSV